MPKDSLLYEKFFYSFNSFASFGSEAELQVALQRENLEIETLIKITLYPQDEEKPIYYTDKHNSPQLLNNFIQGSQYPILQNQLDFIIGKLKRWGEIYQIPHVDSLNVFLTKLKNPSDRITLLYADGKKSLETIAVLLEDSSIDLELRKMLFTELLADKELTKCINGCYTRIIDTAKSLQENRENANQMNRWIRSYVADMARKVAAKRPFAMPESYQRLICRVLDISIEANELHASNYLLSQAREKGMPIEVIPDTDALEIAIKIKTKNKQPIVDLYLEQLDTEITAASLVNFIAARLEHDFKLLIKNTTKSYLDKVRHIESKLNLLGIDTGFFLEQILDAESLTLKPEKTLRITVERRLSDKKWLKPVDRQTLEIASKRFFYYNFPGNIELTWFLEEGKTVRYHFMDLLKVSDIDLNFYFRNQLLTSLLKRPGFIAQLNDLSTLLERNVLLLPIAPLIPEEHIVNLLEKTQDPALFANVLKKLPNKQGKAILQKLPKSIIPKIFSSGLSQLKTGGKFNFISPTYFSQHYNFVAQEEAFRITKYFLRSLLEKEYRDYRNMEFYYLRHVDYLSTIDFSHCDLSNSIFFQPIFNCKFDHSVLDNTIFCREIEGASFVSADLRKTILPNNAYPKVSQINVMNAKLSTIVFQILLDNGVTEFLYADLREVNFQEILSKKRLRLNLSYAILAGNDLSDLDFRGIKIFSSNLQQANLENTELDLQNLDQYIQVQGARLRIYTLSLLYQAGVKQFDSCEIWQRISSAGVYPRIYLEGVSLKKARFIDHSFQMGMAFCDLTEAKFIPSVADAVHYNRLTNVKYEKTIFTNVEFRHIKFEDVIFSDCLLQGVELNDVKLPATLLFTFYRHGRRDFNGVRELKGKIPEKLPPFPLSEASLSKEAFVHLYRQGLRDFRASNLNGFYLSETLTLQAINDIDLKLAGASYRQSPLGCARGSHTQTKRSVVGKRAISARCTFHFLVQKTGEKLLSLDDIQQFVQEPNSEKQTVIKEVTLEHKSLSLLKDPAKINFYWGYPPDDESLIKAIEFIKESTKPVERDTSHVYFYFTKKFASVDVIKVFGRDLWQLGFRYGQLNYYTVQGQLAALDLQANPMQVPHYANLNEKFAAILGDDKTLSHPPKLFAAKKERSRLHRIVSDMRRRSKSGFRSGVRQGAHYELGFALMHFVGTWIMREHAPEPKHLDANSKEELKHYARQVIEEEGKKRLASDYIEDLTWQVVVQCIERGECSDHSLVKADIMDTFMDIRPDIQVGYSVMWNKTKNIFIDIGEYIGENLENIKKIFQETDTNRSQLESLCRPTQTWRPLTYSWRPQRRLRSLSRTTVERLASKEILFCSENVIKRWAKRKLYHWYDHPLLIRVIKDIELSFDEFGYNLALAAHSSESELAGLLYDLWQGLDQCDVLDHAASQDLLHLLQDQYFIQSVLNQDFLNSTQVCLNETEKSHPEVLPEREFFNSTVKSSRGVTAQVREKRVIGFSRAWGAWDVPENIKMVSSAAQRPTGWLNTLAGYTLETINDGLLLADFSVRLINSFFAAKPSVKKVNEKKTTSRGDKSGPLYTYSFFQANLDEYFSRFEQATRNYSYRSEM